VVRKMNIDRKIRANIVLIGASVVMAFLCFFIWYPQYKSPVLLVMGGLFTVHLVVRTVFAVVSTKWDKEDAAIAAQELADAEAAENTLVITEATEVEVDVDGGDIDEADEE